MDSTRNVVPTLRAYDVTWLVTECLRGEPLNGKSPF